MKTPDESGEEEEEESEGGSSTSAARKKRECSSPAGHPARAHESHGRCARCARRRQPLPASQSQPRTRALGIACARARRVRGETRRLQQDAPRRDRGRGKPGRFFRIAIRLTRSSPADPLLSRSEDSLRALVPQQDFPRHLDVTHRQACLEEGVHLPRLARRRGRQAARRTGHQAGEEENPRRPAEPAKQAAQVLRRGGGTLPPRSPDVRVGLSGTRSFLP